MSGGELELRAYRLTLDPNNAQLEALTQHAGAARWAFNHALAVKREAFRRRQLQIDELVVLGFTEAQARKLATVKVPTKPAIQLEWNRLKGDDRAGVEGLSPWFHQVSTYAFQSAFLDADRAWQNWLDSLTGKRAGRPVGAPRFKKKGRSRDSFRLYGTIRADGYRRLILPRIGSIRLHSTAKPLARAIKRGATIQAVTVSRGGHRWYASVLIKGNRTPASPSCAQRATGTVGVDLGVATLATLSTGEAIAHPRHLKAAQKRLLRAQQALSRCERHSNRRRRAARRVGRLHHQVAERRATTLHTLTKRLTTGHTVIGIEDLNVAGMTASARGTRETPGRNVRAKAGLNRGILDGAFGEFRRQLEYKTRWYGSQLVVIDRFAPSSKTCSACGTVKTKLSLAERMFHCAQCGLALDRDLNAARNIAAWTVAPGRGETQNARREPNPRHNTRARASSPKREDQAPSLATPVE